ncbi:hypothetical protein [Paenibacillus agilis]|nr:hypothetical protein [Paenibacillus agilis]
MNETPITHRSRRSRGSWISVLSIAAVMIMLFIALPTIPFREGWSMAVVFGSIWSLFALLIVGAHLYRLLRVDEEKENRMRQVRAERYRQVEKRIVRMSERMK